MSTPWPELVIKHTKNGACNFQAAANELIMERDAEIDRLCSELAQWKRAAGVGHQQPCTLGPLCPYCEIGRLRGLLRWWLTAGGADEDTIRRALNND